jgi:hypothetical protein
MSVGSIYVEKGYKNRRDYLHNLAEDYCVEYCYVASLAEVLGPDEDFDGLVSSIQDFSEMQDYE